jgi:hypothetical protein
MKKSNYVMLTAAFAAAITSYSARGQELKHDASPHDEVVSYDSLRRDTTRHGQSHGHTGSQPVVHQRHGFLNMFRRKAASQPAAVAHNGFGNTMRPMSGSAAGS